MMNGCRLLCDFACHHGAWCMLPRHHEGDHDVTACLCELPPEYRGEGSHGRLMFGSDAVLVIRAPMPSTEARHRRPDGDDVRAARRIGREALRGGGLPSGW